MGFQFGKKIYKSDFATEIFQIAPGYQSQASDNCLGLPQTQNTSLQKIISSRRGLMKPLLGITKGKKILNEMNTKKEEAGSQGNSGPLCGIKEKRWWRHYEKG